MILAALDNLLHGEPMVRRFHADAIVRTAEPLLFERPAVTAPGKRTRLVLALPRPAPARRASLEPWPARPDAGFPQAHVLSNGRYRVLVSDRGGGSDWGAVALTRWRADSTLDGPGFRLYLRDLDRRVSWSLAPGDGEMVFHAHMVERRQRAHDVSLREQVCVAPADDVEVRQVTLRNESASRRRLEVTSYAEVVLGDAAEDQRHPAFSKLFVESEYVDGPGRPRVPPPPALRSGARRLARAHDGAAGRAGAAGGLRELPRAIPRTRKDGATAGRIRPRATDRRPG